MKTHLALALSLLLLYSCGPSIEEQKAKHDADSIAAYTAEVRTFEDGMQATIDSVMAESQISIPDSMSMLLLDSVMPIGTKSNVPGMSHKVIWRFRGMNDFAVKSLSLEGKKIVSDKWTDGDDDLQLDGDLDVVAQLKAKAGSVWFMTATVNGKQIKFKGKPIIWDTVPAAGIQDINVKCTW